MGGDGMSGESDNLLLQLSGRSRFLRDTRSEVKTPSLIDSAIARIEQLERELAGVKALADAFGRDVGGVIKNANGNFEMDDGERGFLMHGEDMFLIEEDYAAYRKARGL